MSKLSTPSPIGSVKSGNFVSMSHTLVGLMENEDVLFCDVIPPPLSQVPFLSTYTYR